METSPMTPDISSLSDQELNERVAVKLGYTKSKPGTRYTPWQNKKGNDVWSEKIWPGGERMYWYPEYLSDISAAWEIAEKHQMTLTHSLMVPADRESLWRWKAEIQVGPAHLQDAFVYAEADTAPRAIVLAFLKLP